MDNQEALETGEVMSSTQSSMTTEQKEQSRKVINSILGWEQLKNALNLIGGEMSVHYISNSHGVVGTRIEIYIPDEKSDISRPGPGASMSLFMFE